MTTLPTSIAEGAPNHRAHHDALHALYNKSTTKGDLMVATGAQAWSRLGAGANGRVLMADSTQATGLAYRDLGLTLDARRDFGVVADGETLDSAALQEGIDTVAAEFEAMSGFSATPTRGGTLLLPPGIIKADGIVWKNCVSLVGAGSRSTLIVPPSGSSNPFVIGMDEGPVINGRLAHLGVWGNGNSGQHGIYLEARAGDTADGGLWWSTLEDLVAFDFSGSCLWLRAGDDGATPHQFIRMASVIAQRANVTAARALRMTGQCGQISATSCEFDGATPDGSQAGVNIEIGREGAYAGSPGAAGPYALAFYNCTSQGAQEALYVDYANVVAWRDGYFEGLRRAVRVAGAGVVIVDGTVFTNACSDGSGGGYGVKAEGGAKASVHNCSITGGLDNFLVADRSNTATSIVADNSNVLINSTGVDLPSGGNETQQINAAATLDLFNSLTAIVVGTTPISTLQTQNFTGNQIVLKAHGTALNFATGGNIDVPTNPYTVPSGRYATFTRFDLGSDWTLTAVSP